MPPKTASRSATNRNKASSPPKSNKSLGRTTRSTRSQSIELGGDDSTMPRKRGGRGFRQSSVESVGSSASAASSRASRSRKAMRRPTAAAGRDLSIVAEAREDDGSEVEDHEEQEDDGIKGEENEDEEEVHAGAEQQDDEEDPARAQRSQSISGISGISGTTACTTHSQQMASNIDPIVAELLPSLFESSVKLMKLIAPSENSLDMFEGILRDLKIHHSRRCKLFGIEETIFQTIFNHFVSSEDYINLPATLKRLLGPQDGTSGPFRPDSAIQAANLANLLRTIVVLQAETTVTQDTLNTLDLTFPKPFITSFGEDGDFGSSELLNESFDLSLDLRTQYTIITLSQYQDDDSFDRETFLASKFFNPPTTKSHKLSDFADRLKNGNPRVVLQNQPTLNRNQVLKIRARVRQIHDAFDMSDIAQKNGDVIDFERLKKDFPWPEFQWKLARWARLRLEEITTTVNEHGGIENMAMSLVELMQGQDSQMEVQYSPPPSVFKPRAPAAQMMDEPAGTAQSFYEQGGKSAIQRMEDMKKGSSSMPQPSKQPAPTHLAPASVEQNFQQPGNDFVPQEFDDYDDRQLSVLAVEWVKDANEKDKENRPEQSKKMRLLDRQPGAHRVTWDSQDEAGPSNSKRTRAESEASSDGGFQTDPRMPNPDRRSAAPPAVQFVDDGDDRPSPPKRARRQQDEGDEESDEDEDLNVAIRKQQRAQRREEARAAEDEEPEETEIPPGTFEQVSRVARVHAARARAAEEPRKRSPWSEEDTQLLIEYVGTYGCAWSVIEQLGGWERVVDQVALKDKARNIKVSYLKARIPLPEQFEHVPLGKKEIEAVRKTHPAYGS